MRRWNSRLSILHLVLLLIIGGCASPPATTPFNLIDERPAAEREGFPYPTSWFEYTMHGDMSLQVNRLGLLQARLVERLGPQLLNKTLVLQKFYVMEATLRDSFVRDASGNMVPNEGPDEPTLVADIAVFVDAWPFIGTTQLKLPQGAKATRATLTRVTIDAIDKMLEDMEMHWKATENNDG